MRLKGEPSACGVNVVLGYPVSPNAEGDVWRVEGGGGITLNKAWVGKLLPDFLFFRAGKGSKLRLVFLYLPSCGRYSAFCLGNCLGVYEKWICKLLSDLFF